MLAFHFTAEVLSQDESIIIVYETIAVMLLYLRRWQMYALSINKLGL